MTTRNTVISVVLIAALAAGAFYFATNDREPAADSGKTQVVASFYPMYFFAKEIGGDRAEVRTVVPAGAEPHDYEPTPQDIIRIEQADLVVLNGGVEGWAESVQRQIDATKIIVAGEHLMTLEGEELEHGDEERHEEAPVGEPEIHTLDPHVWLSPVLAQRIADRIASALSRVDPDGASVYEANALALKTRLADLDREFRVELATCTRRSFVTSHAAFGYLAREYNLTQVPISGLSPAEEPSVRELTEIAQFARANDVRYIFFADLVSPRLADTIAREVGAETLVLSPLEGVSDQDTRAGKDYFAKMRENLVNLKIALQCTP